MSSRRSHPGFRRPPEKLHRWIQRCHGGCATERGREYRRRRPYEGTAKFFERRSEKTQERQFHSKR